MAFKLINLWQTAEERRAKYWLVRSLGVNSYWAMAVRDWRLAKIERRFNLDLIDGPEVCAQFRLPNFGRLTNGTVTSLTEPSTAYSQLNSPSEDALAPARA